MDLEEVDSIMDGSVYGETDTSIIGHKSVVSYVTSFCCVAHKIFHEPVHGFIEMIGLGS